MRTEVTRLRPITTLRPATALIRTGLDTLQQFESVKIQIDLLCFAKWHQ